VSGPKFNHTKRDTKSVRCPRKNREKLKSVSLHALEGESKPPPPTSVNAERFQIRTVGDHRDRRGLIFRSIKGINLWWSSRQASSGNIYLRSDFWYEAQRHVNTITPLCQIQHKKTRRRVEYATVEQKKAIGSRIVPSGGFEPPPLT
jgi:hypothetical protein